MSEAKRGIVMKKGFIHQEDAVLLNADALNKNYKINESKKGRTKGETGKPTIIVGRL